MVGCQARPLNIDLEMLSAYYMHTLFLVFSIISNKVRILNPPLPKSNPVGRLRCLLSGVSGTAAIEYGLLAALVAMTVIVAIKGIGDSLTHTFDNINTAVSLADDTDDDSDGHSGNDTNGGTGDGTDDDADDETFHDTGDDSSGGTGGSDGGGSPGIAGRSNGGGFGGRSGGGSDKGNINTSSTTGGTGESGSEDISTRGDDNSPSTGDDTLKRGSESILIAGRGTDHGGNKGGAQAFGDSVGQGSFDEGAPAGSGSGDKSASRGAAGAGPDRRPSDAGGFSWVILFTLMGVSAVVLLYLFRKRQSQA